MLKTKQMLRKEKLRTFEFYSSHFSIFSSINSCFFDKNVQKRQKTNCFSYNAPSRNSGKVKALGCSSAYSFLFFAQKSQNTLGTNSFTSNGNARAPFKITTVILNRMAPLEAKVNIGRQTGKQTALLSHLSLFTPSGFALQTSFNRLRQSTIDWHCTKPLARNQLGLWFSFLAQPFSTRKHWWILLPSQNLLFRLRWETLELKDFVESTSLNVSHLNWFSEKPFYFYVIVPFLGCLGLIYTSLNSHLSDYPEKSSTFPFKHESQPSDLLYTSFKGKNSGALAHALHRQKKDFYPGKIVYDLSSTWFNYVQEQYIGTYAQNSYYDNYLNSSKLFLNLKNSSLVKENFVYNKLASSQGSKKTVFDANSSSVLFRTLCGKYKEQKSFRKSLQSQIFESWWTKNSVSQIYSFSNINNKISNFEKSSLTDFSIWENYLFQKAKIQWFWYKWCPNDFLILPNQTSRTIWEKLIGRSNYNISPNLLTFFKEKNNNNNVIQRQNSDFKASSNFVTEINDEFAQKLFSGNLSVPQNYLTRIQESNPNSVQSFAFQSNDFSVPLYSQLSRKVNIKLAKQYSFKLKNYNVSLDKGEKEENLTSSLSNFRFDTLILINGLKHKTNSMKNVSFQLKKDFKEKSLETKEIDFYGLFGRLNLKNNFHSNSINLSREAFQSGLDYFTAAFFFDNIAERYKFLLNNKKFLNLNSLSQHDVIVKHNKMDLNSKATLLSFISVSKKIKVKKLNFPILLSGYCARNVTNFQLNPGPYEGSKSLKHLSSEPSSAIPPYFLDWKRNKISGFSLESLFPKKNNNCLSVQQNYAAEKKELKSNLNRERDFFSNYAKVFSDSKPQNNSKKLDSKDRSFSLNTVGRPQPVVRHSAPLITNFMHPDRKRLTYQANKLKWKSIGNWSFYWNYFSHFYGSSFFLKPWSSTFDSINVNKHSKIIVPHFSQSIKKILSPFSSFNNLTGQNIFFKKWHSKKKEGFFYKRITKLELKKADFNSAKYSRVVSLLWGFRSKYKLDEVLQYQKSKYYQSKKAQQTAHQNIDQNSTDSKINKQIVIKTLNKRRRYKKYLELDVLSSWLRDILYFRKMSRKLVPIKKDSYLFNVNNLAEKNPLTIGDRKTEKQTVYSDRHSALPRFNLWSEGVKDLEKRAYKRDRLTLFNLSRFSNLFLFKTLREKTTFFNALRGKELKKIADRDNAWRKNKDRQDRIKHFSGTGFQSYHLSKKVFLSVKKYIRIKNFYQTRLINKKLKKGRFVRFSNFNQSSYSSETFNDNSKFFNNPEFNNYNSFSNSLLFNITPRCLKKISLNFSNKRLLKLNWNKKLEKIHKRDGQLGSQSFYSPRLSSLRAFLHGSFHSFFSLFKNLNRFFIYFKTIVTRQFLVKIKTFFYSGKNSFFVKNKRQKTVYATERASGKRETATFKPNEGVPKGGTFFQGHLAFPTKITSSHIFEKQINLTNRIRINNRWIKQNKWDSKMAVFFPGFRSNNFKKFSSEKRSNLIKTNIKRSFLKKVSTFSTTVTKPSGGTFSFLSEKKISGNLDFILYRKNKPSRLKKINQLWSESNKKLLPFSVYGFKYPSFEELMIKFKNLSSSFVIWRNKFQIRRDYLLLSYIYLDYLGAIVNSVNCASVVFNNNIGSNRSLVNFLSGNSEWQTIREKTISRTIEKSHEQKKSSLTAASSGEQKALLSIFGNRKTAPFELSKDSLSAPGIEIFKNEQNYLLYAQHYKTNCLKPVWSFSIVNHLKLNHLAVYEQLINFSYKLSRDGETKLFAFSPAVISKTSNIEKRNILNEDAKASFFPNSSLARGFSTSFVLHRSIKSSKDFVKSFFFNASHDAGLLPFHDSSTYNKKYLHYKNTLFNKKLGLLKNQQKYLFAVSFFKNKFKYRRKSGIYNRRIDNKQTKIYNGIFLSNLQLRLKDTELIMSNRLNNFNPIKINFSQIKVLTFWLCTLLFHVCLISSLLTSYKSSLHFCMKTLYSSLFVLNKYFVYTKYRIKRLINYIYQNNFEYFIETISRYFSMIKSSRVEIFNSLKFPDSFLQLSPDGKAKLFTFPSAASHKNIRLTKFGAYGLNKISLKKINFSQLFFLSYYFSLKKRGKNAINPKESDGGLLPLSNRLLATKTSDLYRFSFISKILGLFQYVQYKYQTPFTNLRFNENKLVPKKVLNTVNKKGKMEKNSFFTSSFMQGTRSSSTDLGEPSSSFGSAFLGRSITTQSRKIELKNFQTDSKISTVLSPFSFSLLNYNSLNFKLQNLLGQKKLNKKNLVFLTEKLERKNKVKTEIPQVLKGLFRGLEKKRGFFLTQKTGEQKQLNSLKTNLTKKLAKEKNLKVYFKVLQWNMLITLLIGESEVLAELEPYREMHWYFLKKFPIFLRTSSGKDYLSMSDYQADEKIRIIKQKIRQTLMILYLRSRKYESKLQNRPNQSENKTSYLLKNRSNKKGQSEKSKSQNQNNSFVSEKTNGIAKESSFSSLEKLVKTIFNFLYSFSIAKRSQERKRQKIKKLSAWKSILTFLGKYSFVTRSAILNKRFRESFMLFSQPLICFGPIATIFIPYGIKNFLLRFDQIDYQKKNANNQPFFSAFYLQNYTNIDPSVVNKETGIDFPIYLKQNKATEEERVNKRYTTDEIDKGKDPSIGAPERESKIVSIFQLEKLNFYITSKLNKKLNFSKSELMTSIPRLDLDSDGDLKNSSKTLIFKSRAKAKEKHRKNLFIELDTSPLFELEFLTNLQKLIKKYNRVYYGFNSMKNKKDFNNAELGMTDQSRFLAIKNSDFFRRNVATKNVKTIMTENNLYDWTYNESSNRLGKHSMYFDTFDPKLRYYRFSTNFSKVLSDVGGLYTNFAVHQELGPLICKVYTGLFAKQSAKNYLLVSGPTNNESILFLVQALAAEIGMKVFMEDAKRLQRIGRRGINKATKRLEKLFDIAQANVPALVFIEDIHVIGSKTKMVKVDEEQDDVEILSRSLLSKLVYRKYHKNKSLREAFIDQNLLTGGSAVLRRRSLKPTNPIPKSLVLYQLTRRRAYSNFFKSQDNPSRKINTKLFLTKKLSPAFTTNAVLIWKLFKSKIATPNKRIKEAPWFHIPVDAMRSIHPLTYSIRVKVAKITLLAIFTMGTRLRLVKDLIRLFEKIHYNSHQNFIVFAATNKLSTLDPSLRRPGRLEEIISLYSLTGVSSSSRSPAFMSVLDTFKVYLKNVPGFSKTFSLIDNTLFSSNLNLKEWSLINYLAEASYCSVDSFKNWSNGPNDGKANSLASPSFGSFEENSLNTVSFYQNLLPSDSLSSKALKYLILSSVNFNSGSNDSFERLAQNLSIVDPILDRRAGIVDSKRKSARSNNIYSEKSLWQGVQNKTDFVLKTVTNTQLKKQRMTSFETKSKVNAAFSAGNLFTTQNSNSSNNSDYWQLIFSNLTVQRKKGGFDFTNTCKKINQTYSKNIYFNNRYKKYNKSNLFLTLAYSRSGQSLISFLLNYKNSLEQKRLKSQLNNLTVTEGVCVDTSDFKTKTSQRNLFFDSDYLTNLQLWPETVNINSLKPQNTFYNRRKNLQSYFLRFFSSKVGELLFTNSIIWNLGWEREAAGIRSSSSFSLTTKIGNDTKNYILDQERKSGAEAFTFLPFLNNIYGITPDWTCAYSYIKNVVTTSSLYSKTPLISKLLRLEDVSKPRQKQFFESLNAGMLFEYSDFHYRAFFKKNNLSTEENLNLLIFQKYMLNNQGRPLRKYVKLESSNRLWLFRILYTELGTLDNISLRPTSMNYYYRNKIVLKHLFKLSSYQWWNWHLRKPLEQLEDVQEIAYFPCENKYYNPRHRRWILTNGFWGYWFSFDKNFYFDLYEQYMFQSFHSAYLHLDQNREILDYLSKLYICREKLSETDLILSFRRYKI